MTSDHSWIGRSRFNKWRNISEDYKKCVESFIEYARAYATNNFGLIRCPCKICGNQHLKGYDEVTYDLYRHGIMEWYTKWESYGEKDVVHVDVGTSFNDIGQIDVDMYDARDMLRDIAEANSHFEYFEEESNAATKAFYKMLDSASEPIYQGNIDFSALSFMTSDHSWIGRSRFNKWRNISEDYKKCVESFIEYARAYATNNFGLIRCPCKICGNQHLKGYDEVTYDLYRHGIMEWYTKWESYGEKDVVHVDVGTSFNDIGQIDVDMYDARDMLRDIAEANSHFEYFEEESNAATKAFYKMLDSASEPIYQGNIDFSALSFVNRILYFNR
ncbi:hypothetical protein POM88_003477 [Heracleum sosnowskyi]|uniref:Transposase-associated domain-containing protein n=1 Tax=Heracleum sosnowskyi TaxID=360622 RepID=A0AAD8JJZ0_9APIA|nr:hypothetical protein POM88_003477 [Heracleum sosnowskyi]